MSSSDRRIAVGLFFVVFGTYAWFFGGGGWNQNAQFDLTRALVERQTLHIDGYRVNTGDVSWTPLSGEWHAYSNKPPGASFLAAVPYAPLYWIENARHIAIDSWKWMTINTYLTTIVTCGITGALIPVLLYSYGRRRGFTPRASLAVALVMAFGTIAFPFSTMLFAHVPSAFFLLLAFYWLDERPMLAGIAAGIAGVCFYIAIPAAGVMFIAAWLRSRRNALRFLAGGIPFGIFLGLYHQLCFGSPFRTAVESSTAFTEKGLLFGVFGKPTWTALWGLTGNEYRGLFFVSPVLLMAFAGAALAWRDRAARRDFVIAAAIFATFLYANASFNGWHGGGSFGPRYLLPAIPFLALPLFHIRGRALIALTAALGLVSIALQFIATTVDPAPDGGNHRPVVTYLLPNFFAGNSSLNEQSMDEYVPHSFYRKGSHESQWASFNLGEHLFGAGNAMSVVPIAIWMIGGSLLLGRLCRRGGLGLLAHVEEEQRDADADRGVGDVERRPVV